MVERLWRLKAYWQLCSWLVAWLSRISSELPDKTYWASTIWISWSVCSIAWTRLFRVSHLLCWGSSDVDVMQWAWTLNPGTERLNICTYAVVFWIHPKDILIWTEVYLYSADLQIIRWCINDLNFTVEKSSKWLIDSPWLVFVSSVWDNLIAGIGACTREKIWS